MNLSEKHKNIVNKFASGEYRLIQERNDFFLPQALSFIHEQTWNSLIPDYQRRPVWDNEKKSLFIESLILNIPIPPIFLFEYEIGKYEIMDGQQRTSTIREFYNNDLTLTKLETWTELNGMKFSDLPKEIKQALSRRRISATMIINETVAFGSKSWGELDLRREVFSRLNSGGVNLSAQELRNSLYSGPFNNAIIKLASHDDYTSSWGIPNYDGTLRPYDLPEKVRTNTSFKRMTDCENVLRFFTLRNPKILKGTINKSLDAYMATMMKADQQEIKMLSEKFQNCVRISKYIFSNRNFATTDVSGKWTRAVQAYDGMMLAIDSLELEWNARRISWKGAKEEYESIVENDKLGEQIIERRASFASVERNKNFFIEILRKHTGA